MTGIAIYSTDYDPEILYQDGNVDALDEKRVTEMIKFDDAPLDMIVDIGANRLTWAMRGDRVTTATRTGYYIVDFHSDGPLFEDFARELMRIHGESEWLFKYQGDLRWDAGFQLWRVEPDYPGLDQSQRATLLETLKERATVDPSHRSPFDFGMSDYHNALKLVQALYRERIDCTVAIGSEGESADLTSVDLLLRPGATTDFEPISLPAQNTGLRSNDSASGSGDNVSGEGTPSKSVPSVGLIGRLAGASIFVLLALSMYSFVSPDPVHPITGLAALGGFVGGILAYPHVTRSIDPTMGDGSIHSRWIRFDLATQRWWIVVAYGTLAGFAFPSIFRIAGRFIGPTQWIFGPVTTVENAVLSVLAYGIVLSCISLVIHFGIASDSRRMEQPGRSIRPLLLGHILYMIVLFIATGFTADVWSTVIPTF